MTMGKPSKPGLVEVALCKGAWEDMDALECWSEPNNIKYAHDPRTTGWCALWTVLEHCYIQ